MKLLYSSILTWMICFIFIISVMSFASALPVDIQSDKIHASLQKKILEEDSDTIKVLVKKKEKGFLARTFGASAKKDIEAIVSDRGKLKQETSKYISVEIPVDQLDELIDSDSVEILYPDYEYDLLLHESVPAINADKAWSMGYDGSGINVAVLDTGIDYDNPVFEGRVILSNRFTGEDHDIDGHGHGTHVAGIIAANGFYKGVAPAANLLNAKVLDDSGRGSSGSIIAGVEWAVQNNADVISLSLGAPTGELDIPLNNALQEAINNGLIVVVASGNCGPCGSCRGFEGVTAPGNYEQVISVGAVDDSGNVACFSSREDFGSYIKPDVVAPGVDITSYFGSGTRTMDGTSMAAPHVAGVAALLLQKEDMNHYEIKQLLKDNSADVGVLFGISNDDPIIIDEPTTSLVLERDIGNNLYVEKEEFSNNIQFNYRGSSAKYQIGEDHIKVDVVQFEDIEDFSNKMEYSSTYEIEGNNLLWDERVEHWFWFSEDKLITVIFSKKDSAPDEVIRAYLDIYPFEKDLGDNVQKTVYYISDVLPHSNNNFENTYGTSNTGCGSEGIIFGCDKRSYKTDLPDEDCDLLANYWERGDTYNYEEGGTYDTDECVDSTTLREYYFRCDTTTLPTWCSKISSMCQLDVTDSIDKDCDDVKSGYVCSSGECVEEDSPSCDYSPSCNDENKTCVNEEEYKVYDKDTACDGGCEGSWDYVSRNSCNSGKYCDGDTTYDGSSPCESCSSSCNGVCQSSTCYGYDPDCDSNGNVISGACECTLTDAYWSTSSTSEGNTIYLTVKGSPGCNGEMAEFDIWEHDCFYDYSSQADCNDESVNINPSSDRMSGGEAETSWTAEWQDDGLGSDPNYYFIAEIDGETIRSDNDLSVSYSSQCSSFDLSTCSAEDEGDFDKIGNTIYKCKDQYNWDWRYLTCWEPISYLGDSNFCDNVNCDHNEYDCDSNSECNGTSLFCKGDNGCWGNECGCCKSNEDWDAAKNICKYKNEESCTIGEECIGGTCLVGSKTCWNEPYRTNDGYCDPLETCSNSPDDCGKCDGESCKTVDECESDFCVHDICWWRSYKTNDDYCDSGEDPNNSPNDCYGELVVLKIKNYPTNDLNQGESFQVTALLKNIGTYEGKLKLEAGIVPDSWNAYTPADYESQGTIPYANCDDKPFYDTVELTLSDKEEEEVIFNLIAPSIHSTLDGKSAWDDSHTIGVGLYDDCDERYTNYKTRDVKVKERRCNSYSDCWTSYYEECKFDGNPEGICSKKECNNECSAGAYSCDGPSIMYCSKVNGCYEEIYSNKSCYGNEVCVDGQSSCKTNVVKTKVNVEEASSLDIFKQPGDKLHIKLDYKTVENIKLNYDSNAFLLDSETCSAGSFLINEDKDCVFTISEDASGKYNIGLENGDSIEIKIINRPDSIIITNKEKLYARFNNDYTGVNSLLTKAYALASDNYGIVYDLDDYLTEHPWDNLYDYKEEGKNPYVINNKYTSKIASFIKNRCNGCEDVIIIGDDFVVPMFRVDYTDVKHWWEVLQWDDEINYIYSNQPYTPTITKKLADVDEIFARQNTLVVVSPSGKYNIDDALSHLNSTLQDYNVEIKEKDSNLLDCKSKGTLSKGNLLLIGTREDNNVIKCTPWFDDIPQYGDNFDASITLERNVWGGDGSYAFVVSGDKPELGIENLNNLLKAHEYYANTLLKSKNKVYIQEVSNPPDSLTMGEIWEGYVLGNCEEVSGGLKEKGSCMASDMILSVAPFTSIMTDVRDGVIYCFIKKETGVLDNVVCGSSAAGAVTGVAALTGVLTVPGVVGDVFSASVKRISKSLLGIFKSSKSTIKTLHAIFKTKIFKYSEALKFFDIKSSNPFKIRDSLQTGVNKLIKNLADNKVIWKKLTRYFDEDQLKILNTVDDFEDIATGTKKALAHIPSGKIDDIKIADKVTKAKALKDTGTIANMPNIKGVDGSNGLSKRISSGDQGAIFEADSAVMLNKKGNKIEWVGQDIIDPKTKKTITDIDIKMKTPTGKTMGVEVKDVAWNYLEKNNPNKYKKRLETLENQFKKLNDLKKSTDPIKKIDKVGFMSKQSITSDVQDLITKYKVIHIK